jgi:hypothetical protein
VYVVGSGASLSYVDPRFFDNKIIVATNLAAHGLMLTAEKTYVHSHYHENISFQRLHHPGWVFVTPEGDRGFAGSPDPRLDDVVYYRHHATGAEFDVNDMWLDDGLIVGSSSIHGSIHLAAWMGAANIILVGADCGLIDGATNYALYVDERGNTQSGDLIHNDTLLWLGRWERHLRSVKRKLVREYGVRIYSLNPFVNLNLEGHTFTGVTDDY